MKAAGKMLVIAGIARGVYGQYRFRRLLSGIVAMAALILLTSMLLSAVLIGGFYSACVALIHAGWEPSAAIMLTGGLFMLTTVVCVAATLMCLRRLRGMQRQWFGKVPADAAIDAFLDGLLAEKAR